MYTLKRTGPPLGFPVSRKDVKPPLTCTSELPSGNLKSARRRGVEQPGSLLGSYPRGHRFKSGLRNHFKVTGPSLFLTALRNRTLTKVCILVA